MNATDSSGPKSPQNNPPANLQSIANLMSRIGLLESQAFGRPRDEDYFASVTTVALGLFRLVVMGEIKKGKSSFINGLCGIPDLVPVHSDVATSTVFKLRYGSERRYTVYFQQREGEPPRPKSEITAEQVNDYGTERGNPDNSKNVDFISVEAPSPALREGLLIVDTPGVGGLFKKHRDITYRHAPRADAIFFVTDSVESPIGAAEIAFLKELRRTTNLIYFVQTKAAKVDADARRRRMENNVGILTAQAGFAREGIRYFVIDSELKADADRAKNLEDLQDSGFVPLMKFLNDDLKRRKELNLASVGLRRAREKFEIIKAEALRKREIIAADTGEKRERLAAENLAAATALNGWANTTRPALLNEFQESLSADISDLQAALQIELKPGGNISDGIAMRVEAAVQNGSLDARQLCELAPQLLQDGNAAASECLIEQLKKLERKVSDLLQALATKAGAQIADRLMLDKPVKVFADTGTLSLTEIRVRPPESDVFVTARTGIYGGMAGVAIASVVGGIIGSVVPIVGTMIGTSLGMLIAGAWGGHKAIQIQSQQQLKATQQQVLGAIDKALGNILVLAGSEFSKASQIIQSKARDSIQQIITQGHLRLTEAQREIQARGKADSATLQQEEKIIQALEKEIAEIAKQLSATEATVRG
jgi:hypothetical protein